MLPIRDNYNNFSAVQQQVQGQNSSCRAPIPDLHLVFVTSTPASHACMYKVSCVLQVSGKEELDVNPSPTP